MVNFDKGIINLYVFFDVIIDVFMLVLICVGGKGWGLDGNEGDVKCVILDLFYVGVYFVVIDFCKENGVFDLVKMGMVLNVGLMVQKVEEYGFYLQIFKVFVDGFIKVVSVVGEILIEYVVEGGDIWCVCWMKDVLICDWVKFGVNCMWFFGMLGVFWLNVECVYDVELIKKVEVYLFDYDMFGLDYCIFVLLEVVKYFIECIVCGEDIIFIIGNVFCDYLIDFYLIFEVGIFVKMLFIVLLMNGGGLFEIGVGGLVFKYVQQLQEENYLCWDFFGEFCVFGVFFEYFVNVKGNIKVQVLVDVFDKVIEGFLDNDKFLVCKVGGFDNCGSYFYIVLYWVQVLVVQDSDVDLKVYFVLIVEVLFVNEDKIVGELNGVQGFFVDIGGYYYVL